MGDLPSAEIEELGDFEENATIEEIEEADSSIKVEFVEDDDEKQISSDDDDASLLSVLEKDRKRKFASPADTATFGPSDDVKTEVMESDELPCHSSKKIKLIKNIVVSKLPPALSRFATGTEKVVSSTLPPPPPLLRGPYPPIAPKRSIAPKAPDGSPKIHCKALSFSGRVIKGVPLKSIKVTVNKRPSNT